jgi:hypothetical protein
MKGRPGRKVEMAVNKELWPGAGLWLDFRNIADEDRGKVEQRLSEISELKAQIIFLEKLKATYIHALDEISDDFTKQEETLRRQYIQQGSSPESARSRARFPRRDFVERGKRFELWLKEKLKYLNEMRVIESKAQPAGQTAQEIEELAAPISKSRSDQLGAVYIALAVHALLEAAGLPEGVSIAAIAKFISRLTGIHEKTIAKQLTKVMVEKSLSAEQYELVANLFDELGFDRLAKDIRKNIQ